MCITRACEEPTSPGIWWRDDAEWKQYDAAMAAAILQGRTERANRVELGPLVSSKHPRGAEYVVDLSTMEQINVTTGFTRNVKVVNAPAAVVPAPPVNAWDQLVSVKEELRVCQEHIKSMKETVMHLVAVKLAASKKQSKLKFKVQSSRIRQTIGKPMVGTGTYLSPIRLHDWQGFDSAGVHNIVNQRWRVSNREPPSHWIREISEISDKLDKATQWSNNLFNIITKISPQVSRGELYLHLGERSSAA